MLKFIMDYYIYILSSKKNGTLYIGVTSNFLKRVYQHKNKLDPQRFTSKYNITRLVYYEKIESIHSAIEREKRIKTWNRSWKIRLIEEHNPLWKYLYNSILQE